MKKFKACIINVTRSQIYAEKVVGALKFKAAITTSDLVFVHNVESGAIFLATHVSYLALPRQPGQLKPDHEFRFDLDMFHEFLPELRKSDTGEIDTTKTVHTFLLDKWVRRDAYTKKQFTRPRDPFKPQGVSTQRWSAGSHTLTNIPRQGAAHG